MAWSAIETRVALWCSPVARSTSSSRGSGSSVMPAARPSSSSVVSPMADTTTTRSCPAARSRAIRRATRLMRSAPATEEPPNFWTTRGLGIATFYRHAFRAPTERAAGVRRGDTSNSKVSTLTASPPIGPRPREVPPMCFDHDSRPPIAPIAGGALDGALVELTARDGNRFAAFRARPSGPARAAVVILPDVRGLHPYYEELALRFAERGVDALAIDWFGRTAGVGVARTRLRVHAARRAHDLGRHLRGHRGRRHGASRRPRLGRRAATAAVHDRVLHGWPDVVPGRHAGPGPGRGDRPVRHARRAVAQRRAGATRPRGLHRVTGAGPVRRGGPGDHSRRSRGVRCGARRRRRGTTGS